MKFLPAAVAVSLLLALHVGGAPAEEEEQVVLPAVPTGGACQYLVTVADDFVIDVYLNGVAVPDSRRELTLERFGASGEKINVEVNPGDWLVFHVVQNRLRWNGTKYFAVAGCNGPDQFAFVSHPASDAWSACDDPAKAGEFIRNRDAGKETRAFEIDNPWGEGDAFIRQQAGASFPGAALWGRAASTWIKYRAPAAPVSAGKKGDPLTPRRWPVQILSAVYGTGGKDADVTARVKEHVDARRVFSANPPGLGADPNPGWNKGLHIVYMKDGVRREQWRNENETILPESFYGPQDVAELRAWLTETRWNYGPGADVQFHANGTFTFVGNAGVHPWTVPAPNRLRLCWPGVNPTEYTLNYTLDRFSEPGHDGNAFHLVK